MHEESPDGPDGRGAAFGGHGFAAVRATPELSLGLGLDFELMPSGCCGMAGAFGFQREHYEISMKVGERVILPAVREAGADAGKKAAEHGVRMVRTGRPLTKEEGEKLWHTFSHDYFARGGMSTGSSAMSAIPVAW